jgi:molybdopterin synthase catalytic subunit
MRVRVLAFASASDALGAGEREIELPDGSDVAALRAELVRRHPELAALWSRLAVAVDGEIAGPDAEIPDGAEVALLPPVSGGSGPAVAGSPPRLRAPLTDGPIDSAAVTDAVASPTRGAVLLFLGTVRNHHGGRAVERLTYSAYRSMAEERLLTIVREIEAEGDDLALAIVHRLGEVPAGEASVAIAAASPHRAAAYEASRRALERLKKEIPIWKRERYAGGEEAWREEEKL